MLQVGRYTEPQKYTAQTFEIDEGSIRRQHGFSDDNILPTVRRITIKRDLDQYGFIWVTRAGKHELFQMPIADMQRTQGDG